MPRAAFPDFRPHPLFRSRHAQTLAAVYLAGRAPPYRATQHRFAMPDGDQLVLHDDQPAGWRAGDRTALMVHGLLGCHGSPYVRRVAAKLNAGGVRTFRLDLRGCGAGVGLARHPYHSGRSEDAAAAVQHIARLCPGSPLSAIGFSMGGNILLKLAGECGGTPPGGLDSIVAACPPIDLPRCIAHLRRPVNRFYDRYFTRTLLALLHQRRRQTPELSVRFPRRPRGLVEFDDWYTAPLSGFGRAENYYRQASSAPLLASIRLPVLLIAARDDPLIPFQQFEQFRRADCVELCGTRHGGHLGYMGRRGADPDRWWLDWRIVHWVASHGAHAQPVNSGSDDPLARPAVSPAR
jgi:predicted alpha/beta-fold hydrolase